MRKLCSALTQTKALESWLNTFVFILFCCFIGLQKQPLLFTPRIVVDSQVLWTLRQTIGGCESGDEWQSGIVIGLDKQSRSWYWIYGQHNELQIKGIWWMKTTFPGRIQSECCSLENSENSVGSCNFTYNLSNELSEAFPLTSNIRVMEISWKVVLDVSNKL